MKNAMLKWLYGTMLGITVSVFSVFGFLGCGDEFDAFIAAFSGDLSVNGAAAEHFTWPGVRIEIGGTSTTLTFSNSESTEGGNNTVSTLKLIVPNDAIGNEVDLGTAPGNTSTMTETTTNSAGGTVSTEFKSTSVTGAATINSLAPNSVEGTLEAIFEDADGNTREVTNGVFTFSS